MESIHSPKKPGAARAGILTGSLLLALLLALPGAWYAAYHDQLVSPAARTVRFGTAPPSRPSGIVPLGPPGPGQTRTVRIQHTGGQVITTIMTHDMILAMHTADPRPPSNPIDALGQSLCDRYNAWKCEKGAFRQPIGGFRLSGAAVYITLPPGSSLRARTAPSPVHAPGTRAPGSSPRPAAHTPARP